MLPPTPRMPEVDSAECYELLVPELCAASGLIAWKGDPATRGSKLADIQQTDTEAETRRILPMMKVIPASYPPSRAFLHIPRTIRRESGGLANTHSASGLLHSI
jgi:hypothetical protein